MAQKYLFSVKVESVKYLTNTDTLSVTNPFDEEDIKRIVQKNLSEQGLQPRVSTFKYNMKEGQLFIEGEAYKQTEGSNSGPDIAFV